MIDCHAHAFPTWENLVSDHLPIAGDALELAQGVSQSVKEQVFERIPLLNLAGQVGKKLSSSLLQFAAPNPIGPDKLDQARNKLPSQMANVMEFCLSAGLGPRIMLQGTIDNLFDSMKGCNLTHTVVIGAPPFANADWLIQQARQDDRIIPVCNVPNLPPESGEHAWLEAFEKLAVDGAKGFKIHPNMDGYHPHHLCYHAMFQVAQKYQLFIILHTGCFHVPGYVKIEPASPEKFTHFLTAYPDVRVCLAHMNREEPEDAWELMGRFQNLYADTSWQTEPTIRRAINRVGDKKILLGSDWPLLDRHLQASSLKELRNACYDQAFEQIISKNPTRFLGL